MHARMPSSQQPWTDGVPWLQSCRFVIRAREPCGRFMDRMETIGNHMLASGGAGPAGDAAVVADTYGNVWCARASGTIERTDYLQLQPWSPVEPPAGSQVCNLLTCDVDGFIWISDGIGLWRFDGRNSASNADPQGDSQV